MLINSAPRGFVLVDASAKTPTWRRYSRRACLPDQARGGYRGGVAGAPWWLRHSCYPTLLASQLALQLARPLAAQQCTQMPQNGSERPFPSICVHSCVPTVARATGASGGSRNSVHCHSAVNVWWWNVRARVAVSSTRGCTLRVEWQCSLHCQMASSVPKRYARGRVAVRSVRSRVSGSIVCTATRR